MPGYTPPYEISAKMLELVSSISEKIGSITSHRDLEAKPQLRRNNRIRSIHATLRIEANSLSFNEVRDVINGHQVTGDQKEILEVKNAFNAYEKISEIDPSNIDHLKKIHAIMTHLTVEESGEFRRGNEGVFSGGRCIFMAPPPGRVNELMQDLLSWVRNSAGKVHPLIVAAVFHYEFVFIHPFADGNGRMARLWHTVILSRWRSIFKYIPLESQIEKFQKQYYDAIAQSHINGNSDVFIEFMLSMINGALDDAILQVTRKNPETSVYVKRLLALMKYDVPYTASELMKRLQLKSRETFRLWENNCFFQTDPKQNIVISYTKSTASSTVSQKIR